MRYGVDIVGAWKTKATTSFASSFLSFNVRWTDRPPNPVGYLPPELPQVSYAVYPPTSIATGTVVLDLLIDQYSEVKSVTPIRPLPSVTEAAIAARKTWDSAAVPAPLPEYDSGLG
jgi:hypothetical protein